MARQGRGYLRWLYRERRARWERLTKLGKRAQKKRSRTRRVVSVHRWRKLGWSQERIAKHLGISVRTVQRYVRSMPKPSQQEEARALACEGRSQRAIADRLGVHQSTVCRWLKDG